MKDKLITLYAFQKTAVRRLMAHIAKGRSPLLVSPGGSGKTAMLAAVAKLLRRQGHRVLIGAHRRELVEHHYAHLLRVGLRPEEVGCLMADARRETVRPDAPVQVFSKDTACAADTLPRGSALLIDECHHVVAPGYAKFLDSYPKAVQIGATATPLRLDGRGMRERYDEMVIAAVPSWLIARGYIASPRVFTSADEYLPRLARIRVGEHDYVIDSLKREMLRDKLSGNVVSHWEQRTPDALTIGFACGVEHSKHLVTRFVKRGIRAEHIDGDMPVEQRDDIIERFRAGVTRVLFSCMILSEGFDLPACEAAILARPTKSEALYLQQTHRVMRYYGRRRPIILDHARSVVNYGLPDADRTWSLDGTVDPEDQARGKGRLTKVCGNPKCNAVVALNVEACSECHWEFPPKEHTLRVLAETNELLIELTRRRAQALRRQIDSYASEHGLPPTWVNYVIRHWCGLDSQWA